MNAQQRGAEHVGVNLSNWNAGSIITSPATALQNDLDDGALLSRGDEHVAGPQTVT